MFITLNRVERHKEVQIQRIDAPNDLKHRLTSFGILKGSMIKILDHTLRKQTWEVECDGTKVALRDEEIASILVGAEYETKN